MPTLHFVQVTGDDLVVDLLLVVDGHALIPPRPYGHRSVVCVGDRNVRPLVGEGVGSPLSQVEDDFLASPSVSIGERSTCAAC